jgi:hypothetical protein
MSAKYILSELFLTAVCVLTIKIHCDILWDMGTGWLYILAPILASFILGTQISRIIHTTKGE